MHRLVASFLGHEPPAASSADDPSEPDQPPSALWAQAGMGGISAPQAVRDAVTTEQAVKAFEQLFFGEVKNVRDL